MRLHYFSSGPREQVLDALVREGHNVAGVWITDPERWPKIATTIRLAQAYGIPIRQVRRTDLPAVGRELAGETCLSVGFGLLFPVAFLESVGTCLNVHGTLLPDYPGARSLNWIIVEGERSSGVTIHIVDEGMDTGPIILQRAFPVSRFDTARSLARKTLDFEPAVVVEALNLFEREGPAAARPQNPAGAKRFPDRTPAHSEIDPQRPLIEQYNIIRASDPDRYPAFFMLDGQKVCIRLWRPDKGHDEDDMI